MTELIKTNCGWCGKDNWVDREKVVKNQVCCSMPIRCWSCRKIQFANALRKYDVEGHENESWLECIVFKGAERSVPTGVISVNGDTRFVAYDGTLLTRGEFIATFHSDPEVYIRKRDEIHDACAIGENI